MITRNPELLRYVRSELRPARVAVIVLSTLAGALLWDSSSISKTSTT